jgi:hypothetical protein
MHIYFDSRNAVYQCGPYKQYHSTAATFAFKKELLSQTKYDDENALSEENKFTKGYTIPLIQLNPLKSILVFSHKHNSLNKEKLLEHPEQTKTIPSPYTVDNFISEPVLKQFYMYDMNTVLEQYEPGRPEHKPKLLEQMRQMEEERAKRLDDHNKMLQSQQKILSLCSPINQDLEKLRNDYEKKISDKNLLISELLKKIKQITIELDELKHLEQSNK